MGRVLGPVCRICRREGMKLFLKGSRCDGPKCAFNERDYPPGMHAFKRGKVSEYLRQLREMQKVKRTFGIMDRQFRKYFAEAKGTKGNTGTSLLQKCERRFDNVIYRLGFSLSRAHARQLIRHKHFTINEKPVDIPSYQVSLNDVIRVAGRERSKKLLQETVKVAKGIETPSWLQVDYPTLEGKVIQLPTREEFPLPVQEQLIVEFCSK